MDPTTIVCPVCTLFLRPGITLKQHLLSHPKQKVIDALVKLANGDETQKPSSTPSSASTTVLNAPGASQVNPAVVNQPWNVPGSVTGQNLPTSAPPTSHPIHGNHVFIYQQSMSTTSPQPNVLQVNPLSQQYVYPAVFNPQLMPYVYQQQQVIMSSNSMPHPMKALPFDLSTCPQLESENKKESNPNDEDNRVLEVQANTTEATQESILSKESEDDNNATENLNFSEHFDDKEEVEIINNDDEIRSFKEQQLELTEVHADPFHNGKEDGNEFDNPDLNLSTSEECAHSPDMQTTTEWRARSELNKACQTQNPSNVSPRLQEIDDNEEFPQMHENFEDHPDYLYLHPNTQQYSSHQEVGELYHENQHVNLAYTAVKMNENYEQAEPIYTSANILHGGDNLDLVNMDELVMMNNFHSGQVISQVENFENISGDRPGVLMTIGDISTSKKTEYNDQKDFEESTSRGSSHVNIKSDERMPARGELSGQESLGGTSDIMWNRMQYQEGSSRMVNSFEFTGRDSWDASDSESAYTPNSKTVSSSQIAPYLHEEGDYDNENDTPMFVSSTGPPLNFKCSVCGEGFARGKERKDHEIKEHSKNKSTFVGSEIGKKKVKKLIVKFKSDRTENDSTFNNVFTNKLKLETSTEPQVEEVQIDTIKTDETLPIDIADLKTVCTICDCVVENAKALKLHKMEVHNETSKIKHKCLTCGESFPNEYKYTAHLKIHPLECKLCGKLFYRRQNIQLHMKRHLGLKPFTCEICQKSFVTKQKHDEHKNIHTGDAPIKCTLCDEKFRRYSNLVQHRNRHHLHMKKKIKDYVCHCGEVFHSKKKLAWHKEIHESRPKSCTQCNEKFLHMSSLTRHMRRAHNEKYLPEENRLNENVECPVCKGTYLKSSLEAHIRNHSGERPYICLICNKDFTTKWNLKLHKWTHASRISKPFKCDQCKGAFIRESDYTAHMNSHKSVRPYTCNYCGAQFIRKYNCIRHVKEHVNDKTFNCQICGKSFHRSYYLKDHMRVHSGLRPYTCHICGKTSTTKSNHNKHIQIHHAREPVSTEN